MYEKKIEEGEEGKITRLSHVKYFLANSAASGEAWIHSGWMYVHVMGCLSTGVFSLHATDKLTCVQSVESVLYRKEVYFFFSDPSYRQTLGTAGLVTSKRLK